MKVGIDWNSRVIERYEVLDAINGLYNKYHNLKGVKRISITPFESHYAEYLVAKKLVDEGLTIQNMYGKGYDVLCNEKKIEVKSGRLQRHVRGIKHDFWSWVVKSKQWQTPLPFDYLACVALDYEGNDRIFVMPYEDVKSNFTKGNWKYLNYGIRVENYLKLNLVKEGYKAFQENVRDMKQLCEFEGETSEFEKELNKNPEKALQRYSWEEFVKNLKHDNA